MASIEDVRWLQLRSYPDARGVLTSIEGEKDVPFTIRRVFYMHHVTADRGGHAHLDTDQVVIASSGSFTLEVADGKASARYSMDDPTRGLFTPRMIFVRMTDFTAGAVCLVLASSGYDMARSIRSWEEYLARV